jgi:hypothetical protein
VVVLGDERIEVEIPRGSGALPAPRDVPAVPPAPTDATALTTHARLIDLCWARSGDKGDSANVGLIARDPALLPVLRRELTAERVKAYFGHLCDGDVTRFDLPGFNAMNFLLTKALGGGGAASLRNDPLAKGFAQMLLDMEIEVPSALAP